MRVSFDTPIDSTVSRDYTRGGTDATFACAAAYRTTETVTGVRRRKPGGWMEPTNYTFVRICYAKAQGTVSFANASYACTYRGCVGGGGNARFHSLNAFNQAYTFAFPTALIDTALIKARNDIQAGKVNYGQAIGEANQTARLVGDSCKRLLTAVRSLRRGDARGVAKALSVHKKPPRKFVKKVQKTISAAGIRKLKLRETAAEALRQDKSIRKMKNVTSAWLELQYGWKPLISDVAGTIDNLSSFTRYDWIVTGKGSAKQNVSVVGSQTEYYKSLYAAGYVDVKGSNAAKVIIIGVPSQTPTSLASDLGLTNLPLLAWELTPFSFVADWFLPIGPWLDSLDSLTGFDQVRTVTVRFSKIRWDETGDMTMPHATECKSSTFHGFKDHVEHRRSVASGAAFPVGPSWKDPRSFSHMANGLALLTQIFGGKSSIK